ncbi:MAG TPA: nucleoside hydrolase [Planctomycetota bacterium]|nr:nucleoside hydrolase [Planctomycetota bacterium]
MTTPGYPIPTARTPLKVILDTDVGDDIDDALALGLIIASPELDLLAVTTVFGNTVARARQARSILAAAGGKHARVPVAAGCGATMTLRPPKGTGREACLAGTLPNQDHACLPEAELPPLDRRHGVDLLIETITAGAGDIVPITIGPMTNLAMALVKEPRIAARIPRIVAMACEFKAGFAEWNIRCDPEAAALVYACGVPVVTTTWEMGDIAKFDDSHVARLSAGTSPMAKLLARTVVPWISHDKRMPALFDPFAVSTILQPDLAGWRRGRITIECRGEATNGFSVLHADENGPHHVTWSTDRARALDFYLGRVLAHGAAAAR